MNVPLRYIEIKPELAQTFVRLKHPGCDREVWLLNRSCVYITIRLKGTPDCLVRYNAYEIDLDGAVSFYWDDCLFNLDFGIYEGDVYADCAKLATLTFIKRRPRALVDDIRAIDAAAICPPPCPLPVCEDGAIPVNINLT